MSPEELELIGYGSGYGDGDGYGYGDGDGYGSGYGDGDGSPEYWMGTIDAFAAKWPEQQQIRLASLRKEGATIAFWRSNESGLPSNGGGAIEPAASGVIHTVTGPLPEDCGRGGLHATLQPQEWTGNRWWIVALIGETRGDSEKWWALRREIIGEAL